MNSPFISFHFFTISIRRIHKPYIIKLRTLGALPKTTSRAYLCNVQVASHTNTHTKYSLRVTLSKEYSYTTKHNKEVTHDTMQVQHEYLHLSI